MQLVTGRVADLDIHVEGGVATITIDNAAEQHRLNAASIARLKAAVAALRTSTDVNVVVLRGAGADVFCTGILNPEVRGRMAKEDILALVFEVGALFDAIEALPQIVIAGLNGMVRAGGAELALACDIRIAGSHVTFAMPEALWGGFPGAGGPVRLPRIIGRGRALELICTGREVGADEMFQIGLVERVVPRERFDAELAALAGTIARAGPLATRGAKRIVGLREEPGFRAAREVSDTLRRALEFSADVDESISAHREGRLPKFVGR